MTVEVDAGVVAVVDDAAAVAVNAACEGAAVIAWRFLSSAH